MLQSRPIKTKDCSCSETSSVGKEIDNRETHELGEKCDQKLHRWMWVMDIRNARRGTPALLIHREDENTRAKERDGMQEMDKMLAR